MSHLQNDITVLKLSSKVKLGPTVGKVCLPDQGSRAQIGAHCWTSGRLKSIAHSVKRYCVFLLSPLNCFKPLPRYN